MAGVVSLGGPVIGGRIEECSDAAGEATFVLPKVEPGLVGEAACEGGVGRPRGDAADGVTVCIEWGIADIPGSSFGAMLEADLRLWCLFMAARCIGGGCTMFGGT